MGLSRDDDCPQCGEQEFYRSASTKLHLGRKIKWACPDCEYGFIQIDGIDTRA
ncbi:MAG: hypothetical protein PPP58_06055 [Natronomonas sp.]